MIEFCPGCYCFGISPLTNCSQEKSLLKISAQNKREKVITPPCKRRHPVRFVGSTRLASEVKRSRKGGITSLLSVFYFCEQKTATSIIIPNP